LPILKGTTRVLLASRLIQKLVADSSGPADRGAWDVNCSNTPVAG